VVPGQQKGQTALTGYPPLIDHGQTEIQVAAVLERHWQIERFTRIEDNLLARVKDGASRGETGLSSPFAQRLLTIRSPIGRRRNRGWIQPGDGRSAKQEELKEHSMIDHSDRESSPEITVRTTDASLPPSAGISEHKLENESVPWLKKIALAAGERKLGLPLRPRDTALVLLLALVADQCLYEAPGGLGYAIVLLSGMAVLRLVARNGKTRQRLLLSTVVIAVSAMMVWRSWWLLVAVGWVSLFLLSVKSIRSEWRLPDALLAAGGTVLSSPLRLIGHMTAGYFKETEPMPVAWYRPVPGRVITIPLLVGLVFVLIFSFANPVVATLLDRVWSSSAELIDWFFQQIKPTRIVLWGAWVMLFAGLIRPVVEGPLFDVLHKLKETLVPADVVKKREKPGDYRSAAATLILVNILFFIYNLIDVKYLYLRAQLPEGINWITYTHSGCGWLTFALFVSTVVTGRIFWNRLNFHKDAAKLKTICYIWVIQNGILAIGTIRRIQMYIDFSGLTHLRMTGIYGALLIMAGLGIMVCKVRSNRSFIWLFRKYALAFSLAVLSLALTPNDYLCTSYNVERVLEGKQRALRPICLKQLTPEAFPQLIRLLDYQRQDKDEAMEQRVRRGIAAMLGMAIADLEQQRQGPWTTYQVSSSWAYAQLKPLEMKIRSIIPESQWNGAADALSTDYDLNISRALKRSK
jgi:hypothetical protein